MATTVRLAGRRGAGGAAAIAAGIAAGIAMLCFAGCASAPSGNRYLRVVAKGAAVPSAETTLRPPASPVSGDRPPVGWAAQTLSAEASTEAPQGLGKANAALLARRRAHTLALERLAAQVGDLPARGARKVKDVLAADTARLEAVEAAIRSANRIEAGSVVAEGRYAIRVALPLAKVAEALGDSIGESPARARVFGSGDDRDPTESPGLPSTEKEARKMAYAVAVHNARTRLLDAVRREHLEDGRTVGGIMDANPEANAFVTERVIDAPVVGEAYPMPTSCSVEIRFDLDRLKRRLRARY